MNTRTASMLVLNPDELGPDPVAGMDLAVKLGIAELEIRSAEGANALTLADERLRHIWSRSDGQVEEDLDVWAAKLFANWPEVREECKAELGRLLAGP
ncbi:hypothetical protein ACIQC7_33275 [Kitasatospora sp. NPDC088556]|uniref:hypothetical protein n=1 Tax=Kitasatospora sp. NPDC088556 TaxID=3364076 RepID=UPI00382F08A0